MANILTEIEAKDLLGYDDSQDMPLRVTTILLPAIDSFIERATGKDWANDTPIDPVAKQAASVLLARWFDDPAMIGKNNDVGVVSLIAQLSAMVTAG
jgi:hypothetical protein